MLGSSSSRRYRSAVLMAATAAVAGGLIGVGSPASAATGVPAASDVRYAGGQPSAAQQIRVRVTTFDQEENLCPSGGPCNTVQSYRTVYRVYADHLSAGQAILVLRDLQGGRVVRSWKVNTRPGAAGAGSAFTVNTNLSRCTADADSFFQVYDTVSKRWSGKRYVSALCNL